MYPEVWIPWKIEIKILSIWKYLIWHKHMSDIIYQDHVASYMPAQQVSVGPL